MRIDPTSNLQGKMLGRYHLVRLLGQGGMGEVWQAEDTALHRQGQQPSYHLGRRTASPRLPAPPLLFQKRRARHPKIK